jgi:cytochrome P450
MSSELKQDPRTSRDAAMAAGCPVAHAGIAAYPMPRSCPFDPPPAMQQKRDEPIAKVKLWNGQEPWLITRYDDVRSLLSDPRVSADSGHENFPGQSPGMALMRKQYRTFMSMDPPDHGQYRRMLTAEFAVKRIEQWRPRMQQIVDERIDAILAKGPPSELIEDLVLALPTVMICDLLGIPYEDQDFFQSRATIIASSKTSAAEAAAVSKELCDDYIGDLIDRKNAAPQDDLLSRLVVARYQTGQITRKDLISMSRLLLVAGHETSANTMGMGILAFLQNPEQLKALQDDPALLNNAVEEVLRYVDVPHSGRRRTATEDIEIAGQLIKAGDGIIAHEPTANRDDSMFADADKFDIRRNTSGHIAFGFGVHQCLGQPMARAELQILFGTLFRRIPDLKLAVPFSELKFKDEMFVYGVETLPVTWGSK